MGRDGEGEKHRRGGKKERSNRNAGSLHIGTVSKSLIC